MWNSLKQLSAEIIWGWKIWNMSLVYWLAKMRRNRNVAHNLMTCLFVSTIINIYMIMKKFLTWKKIINNNTFLGIKDNSNLNFKTNKYKVSMWTHTVW